MPDLLASFQFHAPLAGPNPGVSLRAAPVAPLATALPLTDFGAALVELLTGGAGPASDGDRQAPAASGKDLPEDGQPSDPLLAWSPVALGSAPLAVPDPAPDGTTAPIAGGAPAMPAVPSAAPLPIATDIAPFSQERATSSPAPASPATTTQPSAAHPAIAPLTPEIGTSPASSTPPESAQSSQSGAGPQPAKLTRPPAIALPICAVAPAQTMAAEQATVVAPRPSRAIAFAQAAIAPSAAVTAQPIAIDLRLPAWAGPAPAPGAAMPPIMAVARQGDGGAAPISLAAVPSAMSPGLPQSVLLQPALAPAVSPPSAVQGATTIAAVPEQDAPLAAPSRFDVPAARENTPPGRDLAQPAPPFVPLQPAPAAASTGLAAHVFAAAASLSATPAPAERLAEPLALAGFTGAEPQQRAQPLSGTAQAPLDLTRDDWAGQMIERFAALRDSAEAADTRIKLAPENLGALEVSIRRDGDRIHVHFTTDNPAARQLIADAAPRLAELADARGLKLGQASVDGGNAGGGQQGSRRDAPQPSRARAHEPSPGDAGDDRIA